MVNINTAGEHRWLGDLQLIRKLATGGMAEVWEARKVSVEGFEKRLAVKVVLPHLVENDEFIEMFLDEGRLAAFLDHPNICQIVDLNQHDGTYYMAMEFIDGYALNALMKQAAKQGQFLPFEHCCHLIIGACKGLDFAHASSDAYGNHMGLVHRDISPQNIMVTVNGDVKVVDFGIAKAATKIGVTRAGVLKGKFAYMSPEQATGESLDRRSDIFALGIVLWELTTGHRLFRADNEIATLHKIIGGDYPRPSEYRDDYPLELEKIIFTALALNPAHRFQDCGDFQMALEDFLLRHGLAAGSKRVSRYLKWLMSGGSLPMPQNTSAVLNAFDSSPSHSGVNTPHAMGPLMDARSTPGRMPSGNFAPLPSGAALSNSGSFGSNALTKELDMGGAGSLGGLSQADAFSQEYSRPKKKKSKAGLWIFLLLLLVGGGVGAWFVMQNNQTAQPAAKDLYWQIESQPSGASIYVNGQKRGKTPFNVKFRTNTRYVVQIGLSGYRPVTKDFRRVEEKMVMKSLTVKLQPSSSKKTYGRLLLNVHPKNAKVLLNDKLIRSKMAGVYSQRLLAGRLHALTISAPKHETKLKQVTVSEGKEESITVSLKRKSRPRRYPTGRRSHKRAQVGWLSVDSSPKGALVFVNGDEKGSTPVASFKVPANTRLKLRMIKAGFKPHERTLRVLPNDVKVVRWTFAAVRKKAAGPALVTFRSNFKSRVYVNGRYIGTTPIHNKRIKAGSASIQFKTAKFKASYRKNTTLGSGKRTITHHFGVGKLFPLTNPQANVFLNGDYLGKSRSGTYKVPVGTYRVKFVFMNGKVKYQNGVHVSAGGVKRIKSFAK